MTDIIKKQSAGGVVYCQGKVLVIKVIPENELVFPKGTIEQKETPEKTAVREVFEETGYRVRIKAPLDSISYEFDEGDDKHYEKTVYYFLLELINQDAKPTPQREADEDFENIWLTPQEAFEKLTHENSKNILQRALAISES